MDKTPYEQFLKFIDSLLRNKEILAISGEAKMIKKQFYQFFEQPFFEEKPTRTELEKSRKEYSELYNLIKKLIQKYEVARTSGYDSEGMQKETLEIMKGIEVDLNRALEKIEFEIGQSQEDEQIKIGEKSMYIAQESDKKAKRSNVIAIIALIVAVVSVIISLCIN